MQDKKKVLLIRLTSLGDVIYNIPLANSLKEAGFEVSWLVSEKGYLVIKNNPAVYKTFLAPAQKWKTKKYSPSCLFEYLKILKEIRKEKFDIVIDSQQMFKSLIWLLFCGAKRKITVKGGGELSFLGANEFIPKFDNKLHYVSRYLEFAKYLNAAPKLKFSLPPSTQKTKEKIDKLLAPLDNTKPIVVISPATTRHLKHWHPDNWCNLIAGIKDSCSLIFTGGENDKQLIKEIGGDNYLNLAGKTDLLDLIELFSRADIVISPDSGSAQIAWAVGKPAVICIYTITPWNIYGPFGNDEKYFKVHGNLSCQPCYKDNCPFNNSQFEACRKLPHADEIINIVNNLLKNIKHGV